MALTDAQKQSLATLREQVATWKSDRLKSIDAEFRFLASIRLRDSSLSSLVASDAIDQAMNEINSIQELLGGAYSENS